MLVHHIYTSPGDRLSWDDARRYCKKRSGELASIHNMVEQLRVMQEIKFEGKAWIGGYKEKYGNEHILAWSDSTLFDYQLGDIELQNECMTMSISEIFRSENCTTANYFVCKIDISGRVVRFQTLIKNII